VDIKSLSVFFPCYNEAGNIENTTEKAIKILNDLKIEYEILIINDGSTDTTLKVAKNLENKYPQVKVIDQPNGGSGMALRAGFENSQYDTIVYNDGDGQFDFSEVSKFIEQLSSSDLIIGYRISRQDPFFRLLFAKGWALALFLFFGLNLKDVDCGFKMVKKEVLKTIPKLESTRGGMINAELAIKTKKFGFNISQVGVHHYPRQAGVPTGANLDVIITSFKEVFKLWWKLR